jgi:hypothetical protein
MYYDFRVGPSYEYQNNNLIVYNFYDFEGYSLIHVDYNKLQGKKLAELFKEVFFINKEKKLSFVDGEYVDVSRCRIYLPNPPKFNFTYSLVQIDKYYKIKKSISKLESGNEPWAVFKLPAINDSSVYNAITLNIYDSVTRESGLYFKKI